MKLGNFFSLITFIFSAVVILVFASHAFAVTDTIKFGGAANTFRPSSINVNVGDTILWTGFFGHSDPFHELQSLSVPPNAAPFGPINTGMSFSYPVVVAGAYHYQCNVHASEGMIGDFTAGAASVQDIVSNPSALLEKSFPNPSNGRTTIRYYLTRPSQVCLKIFDINGKPVKQLVSAYQNAGKYEMLFDGSALASGTYAYQLQTSDGILSQQMVIVKQ